MLIRYRIFKNYLSQRIMLGIKSSSVSWPNPQLTLQQALVCHGEESRKMKKCEALDLLDQLCFNPHFCSKQTEKRSLIPPYGHLTDRVRSAVIRGEIRAELLRLYAKKSQSRQFLHLLKMLLNLLFCGYRALEEVLEDPERAWSLVCLFRPQNAFLSPIIPSIMYTVYSNQVGGWVGAHLLRSVGERRGTTSNIDKHDKQPCTDYWLLGISCRIILCSCSVSIV